MLSLEMFLTFLDWSSHWSSNLQSKCSFVCYIAWSSGGPVQMQEWVMYPTWTKVWQSIINNMYISPIIFIQSVLSHENLKRDNEIFHFLSLLKLFHLQYLIWDLIICRRCDGIPDCGETQVYKFLQLKIPKDWHSYFIYFHICIHRGMFALGWSFQTF